MWQAVEKTPAWLYYRVKIDGEYNDSCTEADAEAGYAIVFSGDYAPNGEPIFIRREGRVALIDVRKGAA